MPPDDPHSHSHPEANPYQSPFASDAPLSSETSASGVAPSTIDILRRTRPWVLFIAILGLVLSGIMVVIGLVFSVMGFANQGAPVSAPLMGGLYLLMALIYAIPPILLLRFGRRITTLTADPSIAALDFALDAQRSFWRFLGIMIIAVLCLYFIGIVLAIVGAAVFRGLGQ